MSSPLAAGSDDRPPTSPTSPRSPRPITNPGDGSATDGIAPGTIRPGTMNTLPPELLLQQQQQPPRPNLTSMLFLSAFFFFMSGNNHPQNTGIEIGPDGNLKFRMSELDHAKQIRDEWVGLVHGNQTLLANYTLPPTPSIQPSTLLPPEYHYDPTRHQFYNNITGFFRSSTLHPLSVSPSSSASSSSSSTSDIEGYWRHLDHIPDFNLTGQWNETLSDELRGKWEWNNTVKWDMNLKERNISTLSSTYSKSGDEDSLKDPEDVEKQMETERDRFKDWSWIKGSLTLTSTPSPSSNSGSQSRSNSSENPTEQSMNYDFLGIHYKPNGTYNIIGLPEGMRIDIRKLPFLWKDESNINQTKEIVLRELENEVKKLDGNLMVGDLRDDDVSELTTCPLLIHLTLPPIPSTISKQELDFYNSEIQFPTGIKASLPIPPAYWQVGKGLGGVIIADQCGWIMGIEGGKGIGIDDFWDRSVSYAAFATLSQLLVLLLLVRQMERTRTPSTLAKVSLYTIIIMSITDSWVFSAHVVVGIMSDNKSSLPMLVPGFMCLCTAVVFGPRYAVLLHRIQAPERSSPAPIPPRITPTVPAAQNGAHDGSPTTPNLTTAMTDVPTTRIPAVVPALRGIFTEHPLLRWLAILAVLFCFLQFAFLPSVIPFFLFALYSFWVPQIWRNARRGTSRSMDAWFIIGTTLGRLALPLYTFAYSENVFFIEKSRWIWVIVWWQFAQVTLLFAQERFGPSFFLPKSLSPPESYNYHPLIPTSSEDPESASTSLLLLGDGEEEKTCSICMEQVDLSNSTHSSSAGISISDKRRNYALAPCGHLFHTNCLSQWMAVKTICPLCKRSLPPL
ncbi:uncharacterized protein IL334_007495 [Kwoniella shivajii]|uniref:RING-type E3 ubiquitin transferase n=1 Tax=Kwoniella shivajii TaxID=564305 RepID=A0ABZ1DCS8_9TREE|nr:hypothetical protein IL334_007495 [Kwoniella shivajii]